MSWTGRVGRRWLSGMLTCIAVGLVFSGAAHAALPSGWSTIGWGDGENISADESAGIWTVTCDGSDFWGNNDRGGMTYTECTGDFDVSCRVVTIAGRTTDQWTRGGIMARNSLTANSRNVLVYWKPIQGRDDGNNASRVDFNRRVTDGANTARDDGLHKDYPVWIRLTRIGDAFRAYQSDDGSLWDQIGSPRTIDMEDTLYLGLAVASHNNNQTTTYTFDNVSGLPKIINTEAADLAMTTATLKGELLETAGSTYVWAYYGQTNGGTIKSGAGGWDNVAAIASPQSAGPVSVGISGLTPDTMYYYRFYASNATWDAWAPLSAALQLPPGFRTMSSMTWDGSEDDLWRTAENWAATNVPDMVGEFAKFSGAGAGDVDLGGTSYTIDSVYFTDGDYVLTDSADSATLTAGGLTNSGGDNTISAAVTVTGVTAVSAGTLIMKNPDGFSTDEVVLSGGGMQVWGGSQTIVNPGALEHRGFNHPGNAYDDVNSWLDLNGNGGLMAMAPDGTALLTDGPGGRGLDFNNDGDFTSTGAIGQNDNYMNLFIGYFIPAESGVHGFRRNQDDDRCGIWLDLNGDGVFSSSVAGLGSNRGEQLQWDGDGGNKAVTLTAGRPYMIAFTHMEGGGGSGVDMRFSTPSLSERIIKPSDPAQAGMWAVQASFTDINSLASTPITVTGDATLEMLARSTLNNIVLSNGMLQFAAPNPTITTAGDGGLTVAGGITLGNPSTLGTLIAGNGTTLTGATITASTLYDIEPVTTIHSALGGDAELHAGDDDTSDGVIELLGMNTYTGQTRITRSVLRADEGMGLPVGSLLRFRQNNADQTCILETSGTFDRDIGQGAGEVYWDNIGGGGGFAARGGDLTVTLEGGNALTWNNADEGFNSIHALQFGSRSADSMVELKNDIVLDSSSYRSIGTINNPDTKADVVRLSGVISGGNADASKRFSFHENQGNQFNPGDRYWSTLVELTGSNSYLTATAIRMCTLAADDGRGLPTNSCLRFWGHHDWRPAVLLTSGTFDRDIGTAAGEVHWSSRGGFAARGGTLAVNLEGGIALDWSDGNAGFNGQVLQFGSHHADGVVEIQNGIMIDANRYINLFDNLDTKADYAVLSGDLTTQENPDTEFWIRGNGLLVMTGTGNTYHQRTILDDGVVLRVPDQLIISTNTTITFDANNRAMPAILETKGTLTLNIGPQTENGAVSWDRVHGGFAAHGGPLTVNLEGGVEMDAGSVDTGFEGHWQQYGSPTANDVVDFQNDIYLNNRAHSIHTFDNPDSSQDHSIYSGNIRINAWGDLHVYGEAPLEMTGDNRIRNMTVRETATLLINGTHDGTDQIYTENNNSATIGGDGIVTVQNRFDVRSNGMLAPGAGEGAAGTLDVTVKGNDGFRMWDASSYEWEMGAAGSDLVAVTGNLELRAGWKVKLLGEGGTPRADEEYDLFTYTGNLAFNVPTLDTSGMPGDWDASNARVEYDYAGKRVYVTGLSSTLAIANRDASNLTSTMAQLNGTLSCSGLVVDVWAYWGETDGGTEPNLWSNDVHVGTFNDVVDENISHVAGGFDTNAQYYFTFRATNATTDLWASPSESFTVLGPPVVTNDGATSISPLGMASLNGSFVDHNRGDVTICWGLSDGGTGSPDDWDNHAVLGAQSVANFSHTASGLFYPLTYYYRCYATNAYGDDWSDTAAMFVMDKKPRGAEGATAGLNIRTYDTLTGAGNLDPIANLFNAAESGRSTESGDISYTSFTALPGITGDDTLSVLWHGVFWADETTDYIFATDSDDGAVVYLDLNHDGDFEDAGELVLDANFNQGTGAAEYGTVSLVAGVYSMAIGYYEATGGQAIHAKWGKGTAQAWGSMDFINGSSGTFLTDFGTSIKVTNADATDRTLDSAQLNAVIDATNSAYDVWAYWGDTDGGSNATSWTSSALVGTYTNVFGMDVGHTISGLTPTDTPFYTFRLSNAVDSAWGSPSMNVPAVAAPTVVNSGIATAGVGVATLQGTLTTGYVADVTVYWGRSDGGTVPGDWDNAVALDDTPEGAFSTDVAAGAGFTYYYRCYATNAMDDDWADATTSFTMEAPPPIEYTFDALRYAYYGGAGEPEIANIDDGVANGQNGGLFVLTPTAPAQWPAAVQGKEIWTDEVQGPGMADNYCQMWWGHFHPPTTGSYGFYVHGDDYEILWMDTDLNGGEFEVAKTNDISRNYPPEGWNTAHNETVVLTGDKAYAFALASREGGGGDWVDFKVTAPGGAQMEVNPGDPNQAGWWSMPEVTLYSPAISNATESGLMADAATLNATLSGGDGRVYDVWVHYGTSDGGTSAAGWAEHEFVGAFTNHEGAISHAISGLTTQTDYFYTFQATNAQETLWADPSEPFATVGGTVTVSNNAAFDISQTQATLSGELVSGGGGDATIYWGLTDGGDVPTAWSNASSIGSVAVGSFESTVSVVAGGMYYYRAYVSNAAEQGWASSSASFSAAPAEVTLAMSPQREDLGFDPLSISGCELWLAADDIDGDGDTSDNPPHGDPVDVWEDKSGYDRDAMRNGYDQTAYNASGPNGKPVVTFDGDYLVTGYNFDGLKEYTVFSVARYTGGANFRVVSSATRNWLLGYHGNLDERFRADGWIHTTGSANTDWHVHAGHINSAPDPEASFWKDGVLLTSGDTGSHNVNYTIGRLALGGYRLDNEESNCEIAEVLIYNRVLSDAELTQIGFYLDWKYGLDTAYSDSQPAVVSERRGSFDIAATLSSPAISDVTLTFDFAPNAMGYVEGIHGSVFLTNVLNDTAINLDGANYMRSETRVYTGDKANTILAMNEERMHNVLATGEILNFNNFPTFDGNADQFATVFSGVIIPRTTGSHTFRGLCDDHAWMYIDMAGDNVWDNSDRVFTGDTLGSKTLTQGQPYNFIFLHREGAGGQNIGWWVTEPGEDEKPVSTVAQPGMWCHALPMATISNDYTVSATTVVIPAGGTSTNITVTPVDDLEQEDDEAVAVGIAVVGGGTNGYPAYVAAALSSRDPKVTNGDGASDITGYSATLNGLLPMGDDAKVTIYWGESDGGTDHTAWGATVAVGVVDEDVPLATVANGLSAGIVYYYRCYATNDSNLAEDWADATTSFTSTAAAVSIDDVAVTEGDSGSVSAVFTVTSSATSLVDVAVDYVTSNGTAEAGMDYTATSGTLTIVAGHVVTQITVEVAGDMVPEHPSEAFTVHLYNPTNGVIADGEGVGTIMDDDADVYLADYPSRMKVTVSGYGGSETLTNFPLLVRFSESISGFSYGSFASATGGDLRFASGDETTLVNHEVDNWDVSGESCVWVQIPELPPGGTTLWARWGNPAGTTPPTYATDGSTWSEGFAAVYHLSTGPGDSTPNANNGADNGDPVISSTSMIGKAYELDGNDRVRAPDHASLDLTEALTIGGWIRPEAWNQWSGVISKGSDNAYEIEQNNNGGSFRMRINNQQGEAPDHTVSLNTWVYMVGTYDRQFARLYIDGVDVDSRALTVAINQNNNALSLGDRNNDYFTGQLDEMRVSNVARSADWIKACYDNQVQGSSFVVYSDLFVRKGTLLIVR